jgi:OOP family OmpA-OmpF porin
MESMANLKRILIVGLVAVFTAGCGATRTATLPQCALAGAGAGLITGGAVGGLEGGGFDFEDSATGAGIGVGAGALLGLAVCAMMEEEQEEVAPEPEPEPEPLTAPAQIYKKKIVLRGTNFAFDSATLSPAAQELLAEDVAELKEDTSLKIRIEGYTDSIGSEAYNLSLSEKRAASVKGYLVDQGIDGDRILTIGFGEQYPVASNETEEGRAKNRRAEIKIIE